MNSSSNRNMTRAGIGGALVVVIAIGGYAALSAAAQSSAEAAFGNFQSSIEAVNAGVDVSAAAIDGQPLSQSAVLSDVAISNDRTDSRLSIGSLTLTPGEERVKSLRARDITIASAALDQDVTIDRFEVNDLSYADAEFLVTLASGKAERTAIEERITGLTTGPMKLTGMTIDEDDARLEVGTLSLESIDAGIVYALRATDGELRIKGPGGGDFEGQSVALDSAEMGAVSLPAIAGITAELPDDIDMSAAADWSVEGLTYTNGEVIAGLARAGVDDLEVEGRRITRMAVSMEDLHLLKPDNRPLNELGPGYAAIFRAFDSNRVSLDSSLSAESDFEAGDLEMLMALEMGDAGGIEIDAALTGVPFETLEDMEAADNQAMTRMLGTLQRSVGIRHFSLQYTDDGALDMIADRMGGREVLSMQAQGALNVAGGFMNRSDARLIRDEVADFLDGGERLYVGFSPEQPVGVTELQRVPFVNAPLTETLGMKIEGE
ncbi:hypothetical protein [Spiribacter vilamensis]|uniref:DUF945 domain-containing protein n=1 Tax=Spiribacter vilamensis TaxID=531306 RepID=A0A4Q8D053_9GAMM|nr:hypothetical protein [Spiribacter vilamensis]RZU98691.1 hypothetical protein EV698_0950 [Spiribacter vilamensis]TVO62283.1 hypothetical protein FPL09_09450 [Spiribacter vilamensis]